MRTILTSLSLLALACATSSHADTTGYYVNATFGLNTLGDQTVDVVFDGTSSSGDASFNGSFGAGAAVGYRFNRRWSVEGEFLYRRADLDDAALGTFGSFNEGDFANTQLSVNALYHFDVGSSDRISGYVGAGLAYIQEIDIDFEADGTETSFETDEFGVELHGGVRYALSDRAYVDAGLRYSLVSDVEMEAPANSANTATADYDPLLLGLKFGWRF